ncbi:MAG: hypothetical protein Fur0037_15230 [Planctomycetota bacterium]
MSAPEEVPDPADREMAEILSSGESGIEARARLQRAPSGCSEDLIGRLDALEFVDSIVGSNVEIPPRIGAYRITGVLGRGGMGTVYLAFQEQLEREVALKVLLPSYAADPTMRRRFRAEARATAALHHRHIVPIYDYGEAEGRLFFAMERVHGLSLDKHVAKARREGRPPMDLREAARRFAGVADALGLAHRRRILHRDVKPGNILVASDGTLSVTDFGLAKALDQASARLTTRSGGFVGTLHYASPEQALGRELTPASDLYSLGVALFEAVTGCLPIEGKTTEATLQAILYGTPRRLRDFLQRPPRDFEAVLDKLLAREPLDRYQDGEALSRDLLRLADGDPVQIRRQSPIVLLWRRARRNPILTSAIVAVAVLALAVLGLFTVLRQEKGQSLHSRHQNHLIEIANLVKADAAPQAGVADLLFVLTGHELRDPPPNEAILASLSSAAAELPGDPQVTLMRRAYVEDPLPAASALLREGRGYEALGLYDVAISEAVARRTGNDLSTEISLYHLYLRRAVANLTSSVARPSEARMDLALASFLRPGASFPKALVAMLDVVDARASPASLQQVQRKWEGSEQREALGLLLRSAAGLARSRRANLMDFGLGYEDAARMHRAAETWLRLPTEDPLARGDSCGFERQLMSITESAVSELGVASTLAERLHSGLELLRTAVAPDSPLQCWRVTFLLLDLIGTGSGGTERSLVGIPPDLQIEGFARLLRLQPRRSLLLPLLARFEYLREDLEPTPRVLEVAARMHEALGMDDARELAERWVEADPMNPAALLERMRRRLSDGDVEAVVDDATRCVQLDADRKAAIRRVCAELENGLAGLAGGPRARVEALIEEFRALGG